MVHLLKKICSAFLTALLCCSCSSKKSLSPLAQWMEENGKVKILSTIAQIGDIVTIIGGERIDVWVLVPGDLDPHSYELVKGDGEKLSRADLIFYNGLGLEHGASLSSLLRTNSKAIAIGDVLRSLDPKRILQTKEAVDPHLWMDVSLWQKAVKMITKQLAVADPTGASYYEERAQSLMKEMEKTHLYMRDLLQKIPSQKRFLVTSHDAFRYFAKSYLADPEEINGEARVTAPEGLAPDGQLNPIDIQRAIDFLKAHHVSVVFPESNVSRDAVKKIATASSELGYPVTLCLEPLYGDSTSGLSYLEMMRRNAEVIFNHLGTVQE